MKKSAIVRIIVWSLTALILVGVMVLVMAFSANFQWDDMENFNLGFVGESYSNSGEYEVGSASFSENIKDIKIHWTSGSVTIETYDGDTLEISEEEISDSDWQMRHRLRDGKLTIRFKKSSGFWSFGRTPKKQLTVKIPEKMLDGMNTLSVDGVSAKVSVSDVVLSKKLQIDTVSGDVTLSDVQVREFEMDSVSANLTATRFTVNEFDFDTVSGNATIDGSVEKVKFDTTSGNLKVTSSVVPGEIDFSSISGDCRLDIPEGKGFTAELDTVSGKIDCDFPTINKGKKIVSGNGAAEFDFDTVSGDVVIRIAE